MNATTEEPIIIQKTKDLCQTLVDQPEFRHIRQRIDLFLSDESAKSQYQLVMEKGNTLQQKQQLGGMLDQNEILDFEQHRETLLQNPVARESLDAQQEMHKLQESVMQYVSLTFELGRVPNAEDIPSGSCGSGCGCGH